LHLVVVLARLQLNALTLPRELHSPLRLALVVQAVLLRDQRQTEPQEAIRLYLELALQPLPLTAAAQAAQQIQLVAFLVELVERHQVATLTTPAVLEGQ